MRRLLAVVALMMLVACDSFDPLVENTVTGTWRGTSAGQTFLLILQQQQQTVAGTGTVTAAGVTRNLSVSGSFIQPAFSATITPVGSQGITLSATVEGRSM